LLLPLGPTTLAGWLLKIAPLWGSAFPAHNFSIIADKCYFYRKNLLNF
jgi:hypothetical protein